MARIPSLRVGLVAAAIISWSPCDASVIENRLQVDNLSRSETEISRELSKQALIVYGRPQNNGGSNRDDTEEENRGADKDFFGGASDTSEQDEFKFYRPSNSGDFEELWADETLESDKGGTADGMQVLGPECRVGVNIGCVGANDIRCDQIQVPSTQCSIGQGLTNLGIKIVRSECHQSRTTQDDHFFCERTGVPMPEDGTVVQVLCLEASGNWRQMVKAYAFVGETEINLQNGDGELPESVMCIMLDSEGHEIQKVKFDTSGTVDLFLKNTFGMIQVESCTVGNQPTQTCKVPVQYNYTVSNLGQSPMSLMKVERKRNSDILDLTPHTSEVELRAGEDAPGEATSVIENDLLDVCIPEYYETTVTASSDSLLRQGTPCFDQSAYAFQFPGIGYMDIIINCTSADGMNCLELGQKSEDCWTPITYTFDVKNVGTTDLIITYVEVLQKGNELDMASFFLDNTILPTEKTSVNYVDHINMCVDGEYETTVTVKAESVINGSTEVWENYESYSFEIMITPFPTIAPTTEQPSKLPSSNPTGGPTPVPSPMPTTPFPTTTAPSQDPTAISSVTPSVATSQNPSLMSSDTPTTNPSSAPTFLSTTPVPSAIPTRLNSEAPSVEHSQLPSQVLSAGPTMLHSKTPSAVFSSHPTITASAVPSPAPTSPPTATPSIVPSESQATLSAACSAHPACSGLTGDCCPTSDGVTFLTCCSEQLTSTPPPTTSSLPTSNPTVPKQNSLPLIPTIGPSKVPTSFPTIDPSKQPTKFPTSSPTRSPTTIPSLIPTPIPSSMPSTSPSQSPTERCTLEFDIDCIAPTDLSPDGSCSFNYNQPTVCKEQPSQLKLRYNGGDCTQSSNLQRNTFFECEDYGVNNAGPPSQDGSIVFIRVVDYDDNTAILFDGFVRVGEDITVNGMGSNLNVTVYDTMSLSTALKFVKPENILQTVVFHTTCPAPTSNLYLKDRFGSVQVVEFENSLQGVVSSYQELTLDVEIRSEFEVDLLSTNIVTNIDNGNFGIYNLTVEALEKRISKSEPFRTTQKVTIDLSRRKSYSAQGVVVGKRTLGNECYGSGWTTFRAGAPLPPSIPTIPPTVAPSASARPSTDPLFTRCDLDATISCTTSNGGSCSGLKAPLDARCIGESPEELSFTYVPSSNCSETNSQDRFTCNDFNLDVRRPFSSYIRVFRGADVFFEGVVSAGQLFRVSLPSNTKEIEASVFTVTSSQSAGVLMEQMELSVACRETDDLTLLHKYGHLQLNGFVNEDMGSMQIFENLDLTYTVKNNGAFDAFLTTATTDSPFTGIGDEVLPTHAQRRRMAPGETLTFTETATLNLVAAVGQDFDFFFEASGVSVFNNFVCSDIGELSLQIR